MAADAAETHPRTATGLKTAVVVIHGIGNQSPMATLRDFVDAVWTTDSGLVGRGPPRVWLKRDLVSNNHDLQRITTSRDKSGRRTDFFEFYWAHMLEDTRFSSVALWLGRVFRRSPRRVPPEVWAPWVAGIAVMVAFAALLISGVAALLVFPVRTFPAALALVAILSLAAWGIAFLRRRLLVEVVGDAARYLTADPQNIDARARIRSAGLALLKQLNDSEDYDRVILACHSLGTVIGFDLINFYWGDVCETIKYPIQGTSPLTRVENAARSLVAADDPSRPQRLEEFRLEQRRFASHLCNAPSAKWKITDFVTIGSPLAHSHFLIVNDLELPKRRPGDEQGESWLADWHKRLDPKTRRVARAFLSRLAERSAAATPPLAEGSGRISYPRSDEIHCSPHHGAVFAAVRWTNIYAPRRNVLWGDMIGGPVAPLFGPGVEDIALDGAVARSIGAHTKYWVENRDTTHLEALREAINLRDLP